TDLRLRGDSGLTGRIKLHTASVTVLSRLKREIQLKDSEIALKNPMTDSLVQGEIYFLLPEYRIQITAIGTIGSPRLIFSSEPELPKDQIFAALLFGRPLHSLDQEQGRSVAKFTSALSEGAINFF